MKPGIYWYTRPTLRNKYKCEVIKVGNQLFVKFKLNKKLIRLKDCLGTFTEIKK